MHTIEVDFDVYKELTVRRETEEVTYNAVIRDLLGLGKAKPIPPKSNDASPQDWVVKGIRFPAGAEFRATYKGKVHTARVEGGAMVLNGKRYDSPSPAAMSLTASQVNGWRFWECRLPGKSTWQLMESLRR
ncbi:MULTISPECIES: DUF2924 domain-containing protein [unclassified Variovorax]|uniref:DUF2924 domain-containing protein n=1 Tax=unclassified Variovorax TaxID=663243 RepID=UPI000A04A1FB|nr:MULTISPECIES: DUF2924 domain-containing protein [unclassified Variovorax]PNG50284.1 hypothetical protein CHC06_05907 [Variovorax sp. B2]PNG51157.1 hypothetical protein CHC07_05813 [Variovorax sp. B4]VTV17368.1 hypothetical protein WDL1P1_00332 [Variovorax sp. WDL1]